MPLGATFLDENGKEQPVVMGSYGIGPARIVAAAAEQFADDKGLSLADGTDSVAGSPRFALQVR